MSEYGTHQACKPLVRVWRMLHSQQNTGPSERQPRHTQSRRPAKEDSGRVATKLRKTTNLVSILPNMRSSVEARFLDAILTPEKPCNTIGTHALRKLG